ncbi:division/cell wall cluster transcriptional repressor MraZ [bacterium]|nr:division/cell wall cluster transcriptional repressor MraZ [bacterium]
MSKSGKNLFFGRFEHKIDAKGRLQIPVTLRQYDRDRAYTSFILLKGSSKCLALVPVSDFHKTAQEFRPQLKAKGIVDFARRLYPNAFEVQLDNQGRILLPKNLREFAEIEDNALLVGVGSWIELWNEARYEQACAESETDYDEIANMFFSNLGRNSFEEQNDEWKE